MARRKREVERPAHATETKGYANGTVRRVFNFARLVLILLLASAASLSSLLSLSPIYGSIPASTYHFAISFTSWILASIIIVSPDLGLPSVSASSNFLATLLPVHIWTAEPISHYVLTPLSGVFGPHLGPPVTELIVLAPITFLSAFVLLSALQFIRYRSWTAIPAGLALAYGSVWLESSLDSLFHSDWLPASVSTRWGFQTLVASAYSILNPSKTLLSAAPAVFFQFFLNPHAPNAYAMTLLNKALQAQEYQLLDRMESLTGYISVLENTNAKFRVLRCDHSLLGGEWLATPERRADGVVKPETIYPVFTMLEAVRLMVPTGTQKAPQDTIENALVIGLGIGTAPAAFAHHRINTTALELDPAVTLYAQRYFNLPKSVSVVHGDALDIVKDMSLYTSGGKNDQKQDMYQYIIHDVFTGGAEPLALFDSSFIDQLHSLMMDQAGIAVNYAGDLFDPNTVGVIDTIFDAFQGNCRVFREDEAPMTAKSIDFTNLVTFCTKDSSRRSKRSHVDWRFREPVEADFLQSLSRRQNIPPRHEVDLPKLRQSHNLDENTEHRDESTWKRQRKSAEDHWHIMRQVLPGKVWELW